MTLIRRQLLLGPVALAVAGATARAQVPVMATEAAKSLAPTGVLRVAINHGNAVLAQRNAKGELTGVSVFLARALAQRLKLPIELIPFGGAGEVFEEMDKGRLDLAFLAIEPERAVKIDFSPPYVLLEGTYLVRTGAPFRKAADLDQPGVRIVVSRGAAYDLFLTRALKRAELRRAPAGTSAIDMFLSEGLEAVAGVRQALVESAQTHPGLRVLDDRFTGIRQAMGTPKGRQAGAAYVGTFIEEMKASGEVRKALEATGQANAVVAPPGNK